MFDQFGKLNDKEFLNWIYERLKYQYKELDEYDYMRRLASIIDKLPRN
jgi:hypothetical protein